MFNNLKRLLKSFKYATTGLMYVWHHEQNFRIQTFVSLCVVLAMVLFQLPLWQVIILILLIMIVLILELMNTIAEKMVDILKPRIHSYVRVIKDMMAAAVFISSLGSAIIGLLIFVPYIVDLFVNLFYNS